MIYGDVSPWVKLFFVVRFESLMHGDNGGMLRYALKDFPSAEPDKLIKRCTDRLAWFLLQKISLKTAKSR